MKRYGLFAASIIALVVFTSSCSDMEGKDTGPGITLSGNVNFPQQGIIQLEKFNGTGVEPYDTIELNADKTFNQYISFENPGFYRLNFYGVQFIYLILNKDDLVVNVDGNNASGKANVTGSTELDQLTDLTQFLQNEFVSKQNILNQEFVNAKQSQDEILATEIQGEYMKLQEQKENAIKGKIDDMGTSLALLQAVNYIDKNKNFTFMDSVTQKLVAAYPNEPNIRKMAEDVEKMRKLSIGMVAPEIALPGTDGEVVNLSSLRGYYVLVDFWAEWCKPCRLENPNIVRAYKKYNSRGFEIFGVSLDKTKVKWMKAINDDGLTWTHVSDLQGWKSEGAKIYNVSSIPASFLLDKDGIIIDKNLRGAALDKRLNELMGD